MDISESNPLGNGGHGVRIDGSNGSSPTGNWVGGAPDRTNIIANNDFADINLQPGDTLYSIAPTIWVMVTSAPMI